MQRNNVARSWFFENVNKTGEFSQISQKKSMKSRGSLRNILKIYEQLKWKNLEEMDKFLDTYNFPKLNQVDIDNKNRVIRRNVIEVSQKRRSPNLMDSLKILPDL
jgi:hypothetical protein